MVRHFRDMGRIMVGIYQRKCGNVWEKQTEKLGGKKCWLGLTSSL